MSVPRLSGGISAFAGPRKECPQPASRDARALLQTRGAVAKMASAICARRVASESARSAYSGDWRFFLMVTEPRVARQSLRRRIAAA